MTLGFGILGLLLDGEVHGYDLRAELERRFGPAWNVDPGQLYRVLRDLEAAGFAARRGAPSQKGPARWLYRLTRPGRTALRRWVEDASASRRGGRDELPLKVAFAMRLRPAAVPALLEERRRELRTRLEQERTRRLAAAHDDDRSAGLGSDLRASALEGELAMLDGWAARIEERATALWIRGSDDPVLDLLLASMRARSAPPIGSLGGLLALREGRADVAGIHLLDVRTGEYNLPFIPHYLPEDEVWLVRLAQRSQGLLVAPRNPKNVCSVQDIARSGIRFVNRQAGAGTRLLLATLLRAEGIAPRDVIGWNRTLATHDQVGAAIARGEADVGVGLRSVADEYGLDFVPLVEESYDLAVTAETFASAEFDRIRRVLRSRAFRERAARLPGYVVRQMGEVVGHVGAGA